jgi:O-antigen/teichoic acid export membrane protein
MTARWARLAAGLTSMRIAGQGLELVAWALLARELGPSDFATVTIAFLVARWGALLADWGATQRGARDASLDDGSAHALVRTREFVAVACTVAFVAGAFAAGAWELAPIGAVALHGGLSRDWVAVGAGKPVAASLGLVVRGVVLAAGALIITTTGGVALLIAAAYLAATLVSLELVPRPAPAATVGPRVVPAWALAMVLGSQVYTSVDTVLLDVLRSSREAGIYNAVYRIPNGVTTVVGLVVMGLVPTLTRDLRRAGADSAVVRRRVLRVASVGGVAVLAVIPLAVLVMPVVFGDAYRDGRIALVMLLVATAVSTIGAPLGALMIAAGAERDLALIVLGAAAANILGNLVLIPEFGMAGAAWMTVASEALVLLSTLIVTRRSRVPGRVAVAA